MTVSDRLGKLVSGRLHRRAIRRPGKPGLTMHENDRKARRFCREWPWSWGKNRSSRIRAVLNAL